MLYFGEGRRSITLIYFEWGDAKARANNKKHGVSFEVARRAFEDRDALVDHDRIEDGERRWQTLGLVGGVLLLLVAHTIDFENEEDEVIRIISARKADQQERLRYETARQDYRRH